MRIPPLGKPMWFVRLSQRGKHIRILLGKVGKVDTHAARAKAHKRLVAAALDCLPKRIVVRVSPKLRDYLRGALARLCPELEAFGPHWRNGSVGVARLHDLRDPFASQAAMGFETLPMVGRLLGRACIDSTMRYAHHNDAHLLDAAGQVGDLMCE